MGWCTTQWKMQLFCVKTIEGGGGGGGGGGGHLGRQATFWFGTFVMLFSNTGHVVYHENT